MSAQIEMVTLLRDQNFVSSLIISDKFNIRYCSFSEKYFRARDTRAFSVPTEQPQRRAASS